MKREEDYDSEPDLPKRQKKSFHYNARIRELCTELQAEDEGLAQRLHSHQPKRNLREKKDRRVAAKETRIRKKMYVELLQRKIQILEKKLASQRKAKKEAGSTIDKLLKDREALFLALSESVSRREHQKVKDCIDLLQHRYGIAGKDRLQAIDQLFSQVVSLLMPMHMRMLFQFPTRFKGMCRSLPQERLGRMGRELMQVELAKEKYGDALTKLHQAKESLLKLNHFYQDVSNNIREALGTKDIALMLSTINIERSQNQDYQVLFPMSFWGSLSRCEKQEDILDRVSLQSYNSFDYFGDTSLSDKVSLDGILRQ